MNALHQHCAHRPPPIRAGRCAGALFSLIFCLAITSAASAFPTPTIAAQPAAGFTAAQVGRIDRLLRLIQERLDMAPAIAETRWRTMSRIEDSASEGALIEAARKQSAALRLDLDLAVAFAQAQIDAGKIIQAERHKHWAGNPDAAPRRLQVSNPLRASTAEPELGIPLLKAFRDALDVLKRRGSSVLLDARAADLIHVGGPDLLAAQAALKPLYAIANQQIQITQPEPSRK